MSRPWRNDRGPFSADQLRSGDPYELSNGHAVECLPTGGRGSSANAVGASVLRSDPDVESLGVDTGYSPEPGTLRAPDVAVGNVSDEPGWVEGVPPLAVEYVDRGQDEADLRDKIRELLAAGTQLIWVVRLEGPHRVEIHSPDAPRRFADPGDLLEAPGILRNPVPVEALYDWRAAEGVTLRNLLQKQGYADLDAVLAEGRSEGLAEGRSEGLAEGKAQGLANSILSVLEARKVDLNGNQRTRIRSCTDPIQLEAWLRRAAVAPSAEAVFEET
ncbi:MAG: Uma2 family endonuclease [Acidobacteriota bacterium]